MWASSETVSFYFFFPENGIYFLFLSMSYIFFVIKNQTFLITYCSNSGLQSHWKVVVAVACSFSNLPALYLWICFSTLHRCWCLYWVFFFLNLVFDFKPNYLGVTSLFLQSLEVRQWLLRGCDTTPQAKKFPPCVGGDVFMLRSAFQVQAIFKFAQILLFPELSHISHAVVCSIKISQEHVDSLGFLQSPLCWCVEGLSRCSMDDLFPLYSCKISG